MERKFIPKRIEIKVGNQAYDVILKEFTAVFFATGSVYFQVIPSVKLAKAALKASEELCVKEKQIYGDALTSIASVISPTDTWTKISEVRKEYGLL